MEATFIIIDDDIAVGKILVQIIKKNKLGRLLSILTTGKNAKDIIMKLNPDIILIDLLLPEVDGIEIVKRVMDSGYKGKIIMISQVEEQEMISNAYKNGILFYINKPINMIETISVISNVKKQVELEQSISVIKNIVFPSTIQKVEEVKKEKQQSLEEKIVKIFFDIDIIGTAGADELKLVILRIVDKKEMYPSKPYQLKEIYLEVSKDLYGNMLANINCRSMEQRIRRTISKAMNSVANLGMENLNNNIYIEYSSSLFEIKQVKQEMQHLEHLSIEQGKINTKKFIEGILVKVLK